MIPILEVAIAIAGVALVAIGALFLFALIVREDREDNHLWGCSVLRVRMKWNSKTEQWRMTHHRERNGGFIQEFFDCKNINLLFRGLDKTKPKEYILTAKEVESKK